MSTSDFDTVGRNYEALRQQPSQQALQSFKESASRQFPKAVQHQTRSNALVLLRTLPNLVLGLVLAVVTLVVLVLLGLSGTKPEFLFIGTVLCVLVLAPGLIVPLREFRARERFGPYASWYRLDRFAKQNGFIFTPHTTHLRYPGMIFDQGYGRQLLGRVHSAPGERYFDTGTLRYTIGAGKSRTVVNWGYLALRLDRKLPHIVLESKQNNDSLLPFFGNNLPVAFQGEQKLSLEGDFDKYFTLYCPREYERDALYVLTPDLMALLIDNAAPFDVEIIDDLLFVYSQQSAGIEDEAFARRMFSIMDTVGQQTLRQTALYADEHVADRSTNAVAPQGRRLQTKWGAVASIVAALMLLYYFGPFLFKLLHPFFFG